QLGDFGPFYRDLGAVKVVIDHHQTQDDLGARRFVDVTAEATGRLVFEALTALGGPVPKPAADALFVALAMDTGWFRHGNTRAAVGLLFMEQPRGGVKVSFRSRGVDVARVAERFGGGGHRVASGATLPDPLAEARASVLGAVRAALNAAG